MNHDLKPTHRKSNSFVGSLLSLMSPAASEKKSSLRTEADIVAWLTRRIAQETGLSIDEIEVTSSFANFGLDSRTAVSLSSELEKLLGQELPPTLIWDFPTINDVANHLSSLVKPLESSK
jgi:acyl carrier protein